MNEEYRCVNSKCRKIITDKNSYICKSDNNFNGRMIWCKTCMINTYTEYWHKLNGDLRGAIFRTCRHFDIPFIDNKFQMMATHIKDIDYGTEKAIGTYISKLYTVRVDENLKCFEDGLTNLESIINYDDVEESDSIKWGTNFSTEDCQFLNIELDDWQKTHSCDNKAELTLLKEICIKELEIRKARISGDKDTSKLIKDLQDLMKTASVDPAKANMANSGKSADCFGVWVKDIEEKRPAEWFEDQEKYKDMDGFGTYLKNYVWRPIENFLTGTRNFFVNDDLDADLDNIEPSSGDDFDGS
jgi:hypothetical protein